MARLIAASAVVVFAAASVGTAQFFDKAGGRKRVLAAIGPDAVACGAFAGQPYRGGRSLTKRQRDDVERCASDAFQKKQAWFFFVEGSAIDSWVVTGLMARRDGAIKAFWYDSAPCGGPQCRESFETFRCPVQRAGQPVDPLMRCGDDGLPQPSLLP